MKIITQQLGNVLEKGRVGIGIIALILLVAVNTTSGQAIRFAAFGDYGEDSTAEGDVADLVENLNPDFVVTTGDNRYGNDSFDETVGKYYCDFLTDVESGSHCSGGNSAINAFFPSLGNHDYDDGGGISEYLDYFNLPGSGINTTGTSGSERYYDFIQGPVHFFVIDSDRALESSSSMDECGSILPSPFHAANSL